MDVTPKTVIEARRKDFEDVKSRLPKEIQEAAQEEVLSCNNYGLWNMAMLGIEMLSEFWKDEHNVKD